MPLVGKNMNNENLIWFIVPMVLAALILLVFILLEMRARKNADIKKLDDVFRNGAFLSPTILSLSVGVVLIFSGFRNFLFIPDFILGDGLFNLVLIYGQIIIGIFLILGIFLRLSTFAILGLFIAAFFLFPAEQVVELSIYIGIGAFLLLMPQDALSFSFFFHSLSKKQIFDTYRKYAFPTMRFITGLTIVYIGLHDRLLFPDSEIAFINSHEYLNFLQSFGVEAFTNIHFVFAAGIFTALAGILVAFGILQRLVAFVIGIFLLLTVFISGFSVLPVFIPYFAVLYALITGNQFATHERLEKG